MFEAEELIKQSITRHGNNIAVACSFGKDSMVVLHMALKYDKNIKVIFCNTGIEFPETLEYKEKIKKLWNLNLFETKPYKDMTYWKCLKKYGKPEFRSTKSKYHSPKCCYYLKEKPAIEMYKKLEVVAVITGIRKSESRNRALLITRYDNSVKFCGQRYFAKTQNLWKIHAIAYWSDEKVWEYLKKNKIPTNPVYTK